MNSIFKNSMSILRNQNLWLYITFAFTLFFIASSIIFHVFDFNTLPSQFFGALIGTVLTIIITALLLHGQSASEVQRDKDIKIFEQKIEVYSAFTEKMWTMLDDNAVSDEELKELRTLCFQKLVFYLNKKQIEDIYRQIHSINFENIDSTMTAIGEITCILQNNLHTEESFRSSDLKKLFNSFDKTNKKYGEDLTLTDDVDESDVNYWHFNTLYKEPQINAFKYGNWVLALNEYGENWRTDLVKKIRPNDIIFLFVRGGAGYIGAFRALDPTTRILEAGKDYTQAEVSKYDIYNSLADGATLATNVLVEPIAFNYKGIGSYCIRRKTIERMDDLENIKLLLNKFEGNDLTKEQLAGKDKLDENSTPKIDQPYFEELVKHIQQK